jgi:hypothetical protein
MWESASAAPAARSDFAVLREGIAREQDTDLVHGSNQAWFFMARSPTDESAHLRVDIRAAVVRDYAV